MHNIFLASTSCSGAGRFAKPHAMPTRDESRMTFCAHHLRERKRRSTIAANSTVSRPVSAASRQPKGCVCGRSAPSFCSRVVSNRDPGHHIAENRMLGKVFAVNHKDIPISLLIYNAPKLSGILTVRIAPSPSHRLAHPMKFRCTFHSWIA